MSSQLTTLVPVFDGTNYKEWSTLMQSYLMAQGRWYLIQDREDAPVKPVATARQAVDSDKMEEWKEWKHDTTKALGEINLRLAPSVRNLVMSIGNVGELWDKLKNDYGKVGLTGIF